MRIEGQGLTIPAEVDGTPVRLMVDTGAGGTLILKSWFVEEQKLRQRYPQRLKVVTGLGLFGLMHGEIARLQTLKIGDYSITNVCVEFETKRKARRSQIAGIIGARVLSQFTLTFEPAGKRLWLEPNARFGIDVPHSVVRSGLVCAPEGTNWMVLDVVADSPAAEADVRQSDRLIAIGGRLVSSLKNWEISRAFRAKPGTLVQLRLQAGEEAPRDVTLKLRDLF